MGLIALIVYIIVNGQPVESFSWKDRFDSQGQCEEFAKGTTAQEAMEQLRGYMMREHPRVEFTMEPRCEIPGGRSAA